MIPKLWYRARCSRCGCMFPNPSCYVCKEPEKDKPETADEDGASLL